MRFVRPLLLASLFASGLLGSTARADFAYEFDLPGATPGNGVPVTTPLFLAPGTNLTLEVYLKETNGNILATQRLFSTAVRVSYDTPPGVVGVTQVVKNNPPFDNFGFPAVDIQPTFARLDEGVSSIAASVPPDSLNRVYLGRFTFNGLSNGTVTVTALDYNGVNDNRVENVTGAGTGLDSLIATRSITITVTNVPEPTSLALGGMAASGLVGMVLRRRRTAPAAPLTEDLPADGN